MTSVDEADDVLVEMRKLAERFPIPLPFWRRYVPEMRCVMRDFVAALDAIATLPSAKTELVRQVYGGAEHLSDDAGGRALAAASRRLRALRSPRVNTRISTRSASRSRRQGALVCADGEAVFARVLQRGASGLRLSRPIDQASLTPRVSERERTANVAASMGRGIGIAPRQELVWARHLLAAELRNGKGRRFSGAARADAQCRELMKATRARMSSGLWARSKWAIAAGMIPGL